MRILAAAVALVAATSCAQIVGITDTAITADAGSPGTGGGAGGVSGTGGAGGGADVVAPGCTPTTALISDLESGTYYYGTGCPDGAWYLTTSGLGTIVPDSSATWQPPEANYAPTATCADSRDPSSTKCIHLSGSGQMNMTPTSYDAFVVLSASLDEPSSMSRGALDASAYTGVQFLGKVTGMIRLQISDAFTDLRGGRCMPSGRSQCNDSPEAMLEQHADWFLYQIPFTSLVQEGFGNVSPIGARFPKQAIYSVNFKLIIPQSGPTAAWDLWIDDLAFY